MTLEQQFNRFITTNLESFAKFTYAYMKNAEDAEDAVSESIEKGLRKLHTLKNPELMQSWFYRILINTCISNLRKRARLTPMDASSEPFYTEDFSHIDFEELLMMLPPIDKQIIHMRFKDNLDPAEIAEILKMNKFTVKSRLSRGLKKLRLKMIKDQSRPALEIDTQGQIAKDVITLPIIILLSTILVFNLFPPLAAAAYSIPVVGDIIRIITLNRFSYNQKGYKAEINLPQIQGLLAPELQDMLNLEFSEYADDVIRSFEATLSELEANEPAGTSSNMSIKADYTVKTNNDLVLSLDAYLYSDVGSYVVHKFCTIDKTTGVTVELASLFKPGADYVTPISQYILEEMLRINQEEGGLFDVGDTMFAAFTEIRPDHNFYISSDGHLVICFDKYEVAAGVQGSPEFVIPKDVIGHVADSVLIR